MAELRNIAAKTILSRLKHAPDSAFGITYNMNLYRGCQHQCIYCDSRSKVYQLGDLADIRQKENAISLLHKSLAGKRERATIGFGSMNDPYMPVEKKQELTRRALEIIAYHRFPVHMLTKSNLVVRDIDIFQNIARVYAAVSLTITTPNDQLAAKIEPAAPSSTLRFEAIRQLRRAGIYAGIILTPVLPHITDKEEDIVELLEKAKAADAQYVLGWMGMTLREGQREYFYDKLDKLFPTVRMRYESEFGDNYGVGPAHAKDLKKNFYATCKRLGLASKMQFYSPPNIVQGTLF